MNHPIIAVLGGTGKEGTGLALRLAGAGYIVLIGSRQADRAISTAERINRQLSINTVSGFTNQDAASRADVCILTVTYPAHREMLESLKQVLQGKILVDTTSRVDFRDPKPPEAPSAAEDAQKILGDQVRVVAAFQNIPAKSLVNDLCQPLEADALVCSDDIPAAEKVIELAQAAGMRAYYSGPLINANVVEGLTSILVSMNKQYKVKEASIKVIGIPDESKSTHE